MNIETARKNMAAKMETAYPHMGREQIEASVERTYLEIHEKRDDAFASIKGRTKNIKCPACGAASNHDTLMVTPVDFAKPEGAYFVTASPVNPATAKCMKCKRAGR